MPFHSQADSRYKFVNRKLVSHSQHDMSGVYPKLGGYHGLSSDDDEDSGGLFDDIHTQHSGIRDGSSPGRHRDQKSNKASVTVTEQQKFKQQ